MFERCRAGAQPSAAREAPHVVERELLSLRRPPDGHGRHGLGPRHQLPLHPPLVAPQCRHVHGHRAAASRGPRPRRARVERGDGRRPCVLCHGRTPAAPQCSTARARRCSWLESCWVLVSATSEDASHALYIPSRHERRVRANSQQDDAVRACTLLVTRHGQVMREHACAGGGSFFLATV
jgi:hypothetical protein